jgi:hypothetical protein
MILLYSENVVPGLLDDMPLSVRQRLWFQHDRAPVHSREDVQQWVNTAYRGRNI